MKEGKFFGDYRVVREIGRGGMGAVFEVQDRKDDKLYALKTCLESKESEVRRFRREVRIQTSIDHKNVMAIIEHFLDQEEPYFIMPLARASIRSLGHTICGDIEKVLDVFDEVCEGISAIHDAGNFHRDIKPDNILLMPDGSIRISDLGLAKMIDPDSSMHLSSEYFIGTMGYDAPEQSSGKNADVRTDIFQLGKTFYQLFTCQAPHLIDHKRLGSTLSHIIRKATELDPDDRYQTVHEFRQALLTYRQSLYPKLNPMQSLENLLFKIRQETAKGLYDEETYIEVLDKIVMISEDPQAFLEMFDKIPSSSLKVFADAIEKPFRDFLDLYTKVLSKYFEKTYVDFEYADIVATKMKTIFENTGSVDIKGFAIRNTLRVSSWCNRYRAMGIFDAMLKSISDNEEASLVAQILSEEMNHYRKYADRVSDRDLHALIVDIKSKALTWNREKDDDFDWIVEWINENV